MQPENRTHKNGDERTPERLPKSRRTRCRSNEGVCQRCHRLKHTAESDQLPISDTQLTCPGGYTELLIRTILFKYIYISRRSPWDDPLLAGATHQGLHHREDGEHVPQLWLKGDSPQILLRGDSPTFHEEETIPQLSWRLLQQQ